MMWRTLDRPAPLSGYPAGCPCAAKARITVNYSLP
jgi:hypothetical protein